MIMENTLFVTAEIVAKDLGVSKPFAYKLVRQMNDELNAKLHGDDFYSISLIMAATSSDGVETEITSKKWPTK